MTNTELKLCDKCFTIKNIANGDTMCKRCKIQTVKRW